MNWIHCACRFGTMSLISALSAASAALGADWPQYRGPQRSDVSEERGLLQQWPADGPKLLWSYHNAGVGYAGPAVVGGRVFIVGGRGPDEYLIALDSAGDSAKEAWAVRIGPTFQFTGNQWSAGPSATPTVDGDHIYALGGNGDLVCVQTGRRQGSLAG